MATKVKEIRSQTPYTRTLANAQGKTKKIEVIGAMQNSGPACPQVRRKKSIPAPCGIANPWTFPALISRSTFTISN